MDDLPELVYETVEYDGKTYWAVPDYDKDLYENSCHGCKFKDMTLRDCQTAIGRYPGGNYDTWCVANEERNGVIWINKKYYSRYIKQRVIDRMEKR